VALAAKPDGVHGASFQHQPVWAAGVKAPEVLKRLDRLEINRINQLVVEPTSQTTRSVCPSSPMPAGADEQCRTSTQAQYSAGHLQFRIRRE
jgi:NADH dehydrogenase